MISKSYHITLGINKESTFEVLIIMKTKKVGLTSLHNVKKRGRSV